MSGRRRDERKADVTMTVDDCVLQRDTILKPDCGPAAFMEHLIETGRLSR